MSRRPASVTQADIARALRAAKQAGAGRVRVRDGEITIELAPVPIDEAPATATNSPDERYAQWKRNAGAA
jgi:hypothetical protein